MIQKNRMVRHLLELIRIDSPSRKERDVAMRLKKDLEDMGAVVSFDEAGEKINGTIGNLIAHFKGDQSKASPFLLSAHMDTVQPGEGIKPEVLGNIIKTDGTTVLGGDDKTGGALVKRIPPASLSKTKPIRDLSLEISRFFAPWSPSSSQIVKITSRSL